MYHPTAMFRRLSWRDWMEGVVLAAGILLSFLALMSLVDFLRMRPEPRPRLGEEPQPLLQGVIDTTLKEYEQHRVPTDDNSEEDDNSDEDDDSSWNELDDDDESSVDDDEDPVFPRAPPPQFHNREPINLPPDLDMEDAVDINVALDDLLGVRGPLLTVVRNLLWFLAFNTVYLGFFAFTPHVIGSMACSVFLGNATLFATNNETQFNLTESWSVSNIVAAMEQESVKHNTTLRIPDLSRVLAGYIFSAFVFVLLRLVANVGARLRAPHRGVNNIQQAALAGHDAMEPHDDVELGMALATALDFFTSVIKICALLFLKMFSLPVVLGVCLDLVTMHVLGATLDDRVQFGGRDLFSFLLLHWVVGIAFMLLVTVSVLQLREVVHPQLLSQVIRPQEPHPDLIGNLMNETVPTHVRRLFLSFCIYLALLGLLVQVPLLAMESLGLSYGAMTLKFAYTLLPEIQAPIELLVFHLCMLTLLERYKNSIGWMQHKWLQLTTRAMHLSDRMLPHEVAKFRLVCGLDVYTNNQQILPFWYDLVEADERVRESMLAECCGGVTGEVPEAVGTSRASGRRLPHGCADYLELPRKNARPPRIPTSVGRFRLKVNSDMHVDPPIIEVWEEVRGALIPRPPENWDDLGVGGADVQGRWGWKYERKSTIEEGVAAREAFFPKGQSIFVSLWVAVRLVVLFLASWMLTSFVLLAGVAVPLVSGRFILSVLQVPDTWVHDPFGFALGFGVLIPIAHIVKFVGSSDQTPWARFMDWIVAFRFPSPRKAVLLLIGVVGTFGILPLLIGFLYEVVFIKPASWFVGEETWFEPSHLIGYGKSGLLLLIDFATVCIGDLWRGNFWANEVPMNPADARAAAWYRTANHTLRLSWHGRYGRFGRMWECLWMSVLEWDYSLVRRETILDDFLVPIVIDLVLVVVHTLAWIVAMNISPEWALPVAVMSWSTRAMVVIMSAGLFLKQWEDQMSDWFNHAHDAAFDDRYLIGQTLVNFSDH